MRLQPRCIGVRSLVGGRLGFGDGGLVREVEAVKLIERVTAGEITTVQYEQLLTFLTVRALGFDRQGVLTRNDPSAQDAGSYVRRVRG